MYINFEYSNVKNDDTSKAKASYYCKFCNYNSLI